MKSGTRPQLRARQIEWREWFLWSLAITVTLALTVGMVFLTFAGDWTAAQSSYWFDLKQSVRGLAALVLLFDIYTAYQQLQLQRIRRQLSEQDELFRVITENAADMIAVVDTEGQRLYNSPAYQKVLGYSGDELASGAALDYVHPADRERVAMAAAKARASGLGERLEYRMRHKDGSWRFLESTASPVKNSRGEIETLVIVNRDISDRKRAEDALAHSTIHDGLTNLPNRVLFVDRVERALIRARRHSDYKFAVLFIDVDDFRVVNDSLGHTVGDEVLVQLAKRLLAGFRESDSVARSSSAGVKGPLLPEDEVARFAGDEFAVLLDDITNPSHAIRVGRRIQEKLSVPFNVAGDQTIVVAVSIGAVLSSTSYERAGDLLRDAEIAMYRAKGGGKGRCEVFDAAMHSGAVRRLKLETDLRRALEHGELLVHYQPIVALDTGRITGFEALSRWRTPAGMIPPSEFIPVADETGLILSINQQLYLQACRQLRVWQMEFVCDPPLTVSLNIAPKQFDQPELPSEIETMLRETGVSPSTVHFEIMETIAMGDSQRALTLLTEFKLLGVRLSIDDFGIGYSSLSRLPKFPVDALKIDRSFICDMTGNRDSYEIVRLIVMLAHSLQLKVIAEGVEHPEEVEALRSLGCQLAQGYLFSPAVDEGEAGKLLAKQSALFC